MICPKCKTENSDEAVFCAHCGFKLKTICPKCKMTNALNAPKCSNCGLRLIRFCPNCQTPNTPISEKCKKCAIPLLKKCPKCNAINPLSASHCKKCNALLEDKQIDFSPKSNILIELSNGSILNEKISPKELAEKLIKKFFQTVLLTLKPYELKALKVSTYAVGTELETIDDTKALEIAQQILSEFQSLNEKLAHTHLSYELKIFVSQALSIKHRFGSDLLQKVSNNTICTDAAVAMSQKDSFNFAPVAPGIYEIKEPKTEPEQITQPQENIKTPQDIETLAIEQELQTEPEIEIQVEPTVIEPTAQEPEKEEPKQEKPQHQGPTERQIAQQNLYNMLKKRDGGFISILGEPGIGKKTVLNLALAQLAEKNFCLLQLDCHPSLNTVPFASLQNLIRSMFSLPLINYEAEKNLTIVRNAMSQSLGIVSDDVVNPILNLLVPKADDTKDINQAKEELIFATKELFKAISKMQKVVLLAKEIEFLDKSSAEVLDAMIDDGLLKDTFLITTTSNNSHISAFMQSEQIAFNNIGSVKLNPFMQEETLTELAYYIKNTEEIPDVILEQIKEKTQGWPLFLEEIIVFLGQAGFVSVGTDGVSVRPEISELILPDAIEELIAVRIDSLFSQNEVLHQFITNAACLGYAFYPLIIQHVLGLDNETFGSILQTLVNTGLLHTHDNVNYKFKNKFMYEVIRNIVIKNEEQEKQINLNLLKVIIDMNESNSSQTAHIAKKAQDFQTAFTLWTMAAKEANSTGDKILYLFAQKEALANIDYSDYPDKEDRKIALQEQLGINNYLSTPEEAISFLAQAISLYEQKNDRKKIIELCGYIVKSLALLGNIQEATEYIDKTIEYIDSEKMPLELALLKFIRLKFLVESGYLGEVVSTIQTEIMPSLQQGIKNQNDFSDKEFEIIKDTVMQSQIILIKALSLQGNKNYYNVLELFVNSGPDEESQIKVFVIDALHNTLNGMPDESNISVEKTENILNGTNIEHKAQIMLELDLIKTANKCLYEQGSNTQEIAMLAQKARNLNNSFAYNCAQILFIKQLFDNKDFANAANIVNDCLNFFASQKIALFAIPCWALLSKIQAKVGSFDQAVSIAQQALDVASKPQIQNNYFCAYLKKLLSDFFMEQDDFDMAKMHLEQAIEFAKVNDLLFFQGKLYLDLAKLHQKTLENSENQEEVKETIIKLVQTASEISTSVESKFLQQQIEKIKEELVIL